MHYRFGFVIAGSTNTWQQTIVAAPAEEMYAADDLRSVLITPQVLRAFVLCMIFLSQTFCLRSNAGTLNSHTVSLSRCYSTCHPTLFLPLLSRCFFCFVLFDCLPFTRSGRVCIETSFYDGDLFIARTLFRIYYEWRVGSGLEVWVYMYCTNQRARQPINHPPTLLISSTSTIKQPLWIVFGRLIHLNFWFFAGPLMSYVHLMNGRKWFPFCDFNFNFREH